MVVGVIGLAFAEMGTMKAASPEEFGRVIRWVHLVYAFGIVGSLGFVQFYFGTGRRWLLAIALDPEFSRTHFVYVIYTAASRANEPVFRVARFREVRDLLGEEAVLLDGEGMARLDCASAGKARV